MKVHHGRPKGKAFAMHTHSGVGTMIASIGDFDAVCDQSTQCDILDSSTSTSPKAPESEKSRTSIGDRTCPTHSPVHDTKSVGITARTMHLFRLLDANFLSCFRSKDKKARKSLSPRSKLAKRELMLSERSPSKTSIKSKASTKVSFLVIMFVVGCRTHNRLLEHSRKQAKYSQAAARQLE